MTQKTRHGSAKAAACLAFLIGACAANPAFANHIAGHTEAAPVHEHTHDPAAAGGPEKSASLSEASKAFAEAMQKMHREMAIPYVNDVDVDFVRGMIPHHQGAIEQAQTLLKYSKNPRLRLLAGGIIATQKREIKFMKYWLEQHEKGIVSNDMPVWLKSNPANLDEAQSPPRSNQ